MPCACGGKVPVKVKFFCWLLHNGRLNCRAFLHRKNIRRLEDSFCERCTGVLETQEHIFGDCPIANAVWGLAGISF